MSSDDEVRRRSVPKPAPSDDDSSSHQRVTQRQPRNASPSPPSPQSAIAFDPSSSDPPKSLMTRFIFTPIRMISFLISLALIGRRNQSYRVQQQTYTDPSIFSRMKQALFSLWQDAEPYPATQTTGVGPGDDRSKRRREEDLWTLKKKHRKMMRMEIKDALEMRKRVVVGLLVLMFLFCGCWFWIISWLWRRWMG